MTPCASNVATVTITVKPPVANDDAYTTPSGATLEVDAPGVLANDESGNDPLGDPFYAEGRSIPTHGDLDLGPDGHLTYSPAAGFAGTDSFTYCLNSSHLPKTNCESNVANVTITVTATHTTTPAPPGTTAPHSPAHPQGPSDEPTPVTSSAAPGGLASTGSDLRWPGVLGATLLALGVASAFIGRRRGRRSA